MNILEALRSKKKFKRNNDPTWHHIINENYPCMNIKIDSLLAEDWEIEQKEVTITEETFDIAWNKALKWMVRVPEDGPYLKELEGQLKKHLKLIDE